MTKAKIENNVSLITGHAEINWLRGQLDPAVNCVKSPAVSNCSHSGACALCCLCPQGTPLSSSTGWGSFRNQSYMFSSVQFRRSVVSDSLRPHELQHARPPCPSPTLGVHWDSRPSSQWCHPAISSSVLPFSSCPQSLPASESFPVTQLFAWGGQTIWVSALASFLPKKSQDWSPLEWTGWLE